VLTILESMVLAFRVHSQSLVQAAHWWFPTMPPSHEYLLLLQPAALIAPSKRPHPRYSQLLMANPPHNRSPRALPPELRSQDQWLRSEVRIRSQDRVDRSSRAGIRRPHCGAARRHRAGRQCVSSRNCDSSSSFDVCLLSTDVRHTVVCQVGIVLTGTEDSKEQSDATVERIGLARLGRVRMALWSMTAR